MAHGHRLLLESHPFFRSRVKAIAGLDPSPEAQTSMTKKGLFIASSMEDLLNVKDLHAVLIASPPQFHAEQAVAALEAGKHVYSEVPMALTAQEVEKIVAVEEKHPQLKYQYGENYCFIAEVMYAGYLASTGKIGPTIYAEAEYLHDVTYRWRQHQRGSPSTPSVKSWYSLFDPLAYAHSIGPTQVALGGLKTPMEFTEVQSYGNDIGALEVPDSPAICSPAYGFHVALFKTTTGAIAKCANASYLS